MTNDAIKQAQINESIVGAIDFRLKNFLIQGENAILSGAAELEKEMDEFGRYVSVLARKNHLVFTAHLEAGFSKTEAFELTKIILSKTHEAT